MKSFVLEIGNALPPSIRLRPTRPYSGSPIGTTYTVAVFPSLLDKSEVVPSDNKETINMMFWVHETFPPVINIRPTVSVSRENMFSDGEIVVHVGQ